MNKDDIILSNSLISSVTVGTIKDGEWDQILYHDSIEDRAKLNLTPHDVDELREFLSRGCEYSGTQETINDWTSEVMKELGSKCAYIDEIELLDIDGKYYSLEDFVNLFWDKAVKGILNVIKTQ